MNDLKQQLLDLDGYAIITLDKKIITIDDYMKTSHYNEKLQSVINKFLKPDSKNALKQHLLDFKDSDFTTLQLLDLKDYAVITPDKKLITIDDYMKTAHYNEKLENVVEKFLTPDKQNELINLFKNGK